MRRRPEHDLFGEARQMHRADRRGRRRLDHEIAVRNAVERIGGRPVEAKRLCRREAVDRKRGAGERRGAQRAFVEPCAGIARTATVAREHFDIGEQMMAEGDRLGRLQMGEARHHRAGEVKCLFGERDLQRAICLSSASMWRGLEPESTRPDRCANAPCADGRPRDR